MTIPIVKRDPKTKDLDAAVGTGSPNPSKPRPQVPQQQPDKKDK